MADLKRHLVKRQFEIHLSYFYLDNSKVLLNAFPGILRSFGINAARVVELCLLFKFSWAPQDVVFAFNRFYNFFQVEKGQEITSDGIAKIFCSAKNVKGQRSYYLWLLLSIIIPIKCCTPIIKGMLLFYITKMVKYFLGLKIRIMKNDFLEWIQVQWDLSSSLLLNIFKII